MSPWRRQDPALRDREETGFGNESSNRSLGWSMSKVVEKVQGLSLC